MRSFEYNDAGGLDLVLDNLPVVWNGECGPGYMRNATNDGCVPVDDIHYVIDCPTNYRNEHGVCIPTGGIKAPSQCECAAPSGGMGLDSISGDACDCHITPNPTIITLNPATVAPFANIENQIKTFYANNKGLSLAILAGAAYLLLKGK